jgi:hypothetical protein
MSRYNSRDILTNDKDLYKEVFRKRGIRYARQFSSPTLRYPTEEEIDTLQTIGHIWAVGDRFYKLAHKYYGDSEKWWIIAWYNQKPTESHAEIGETVFIPLPLDRILQYLDV